MTGIRLVIAALHTKGERQAIEGILAQLSGFGSFKELGSALGADTTQGA